MQLTDHRYTKQDALILFIILLTSYCAIFLHLDSISMRMWDESSYALNAQEMIENKDYIVVRAYGAPDLYNSKPPFAIWSMTVGIRLFGFNELGARFASAMFSFATVLLLYFLGKHVLKNRLLSLVMPLVLISSSGYMGDHIARTGDTDSIIAFWSCFAALCFYGFTTSASRRQQGWYLLFTALGVSFACLTKGIAGLLILPGLFAWAVYSKKLKALFTHPVFYAGVLLFIVLVPGYYYLRELKAPGYIQAVLDNEIGGRLERQGFLNPEPLPFFHYLIGFGTHKRYWFWAIVLPLALFTMFIKKAHPGKQALMFFGIVFSGTLLMLSLSSTKLDWYDSQLYPLMAGGIGCAFYVFADYSPKITPKKVWILYSLVFISSFVFIVHRNLRRKEDSHLPVIINKIRAEGVNDTLNLISSDYFFPPLFYMKQDQMKGFASRQVNHESPLLQKGSHIITYKTERDVDVNNRFILDTLLSFEECRYYRIIDYRTPVNQ